MDRARREKLDTSAARRDDRFVNRSQLLSFVLVAAAALLLLFARLPSHTNDFCDPDVAQMAYGADDLLAGGTIYENCVETKPPGTYLVFAASFALFGRSLTPVYWLATVLHLLTLLMLAGVAWRAAGEIAATFTAWFYAALAVTVGAAGNCPNHETWMAFPLALAFAILLDAHSRLRARHLFAVGALVGAAWLMKQQAAVFALAGVGWLAVERPFDRRRFATRLCWLAVGGLTPLIVTALVWSAKGGLPTMLADLRPGRLGSYLDAASLPDIYSWAWRRGLTHLQAAWPAWMAIILGTLAWRRGFDERRLFPRLLFFVAVAVLAVAAGTRFFSHYFIVLAAPLALTGGYGAALASRWLPGTTTKHAAAVLTLVAVLLGLRLELTEATLFATGRDLRDPAVTAFVARDLDLENRVTDRAHQKLGEYFAAETRPDETIYVWPYHPQIYFWADRRAPTKHYCYFDLAVGLPTNRGPWHVVVGPFIKNSRRDLLATLAARPPRFVVFPAAQKAWDKPFEELENWVTRWYVPDRDAPGEGFRVYRKP